MAREEGEMSHNVKIKGYVKVSFAGSRKYERFCEVRGCTLSAFKSEKNGDVDREGTIMSARAGGKQADVVVEVRNDEKNSEWVLIVPKEQHSNWLSALHAANDTRFEKHYKLGLSIGEGAFATVHMCYHIKSNELAAVKLIAKAKADADKLKTIRREVSTHRDVSESEGVVRMLDVFEDDRMLYVVLEYMMKDLFDMQTAVGTFTEGQTRAIMRDILSGLRHCHARNVVHRDVKPENLFCSKETWPARVKLADFGLSRFWFPDNGDTMTSFVGTNEYVAPEVSLEKPYGFASDLWSSGVVMFELITGRRPFNGDSEQELLRAVRSGSYSMSSSRWSRVSDAGKSLMKSLLTLDQNKRVTAQAALCHPWFDGRMDGDMDHSESFGYVNTRESGRSLFKICGTKLFRIAVFVVRFALRINALHLAKITIVSPPVSPVRRGSRAQRASFAAANNTREDEFLFSPSKESPRLRSPMSSGALHTNTVGSPSANDLGLFGRRGSAGQSPSPQPTNKTARFMRKMTDQTSTSENDATPAHHGSSVAHKLSRLPSRTNVESRASETGKPASKQPSARAMISNHPPGLPLSQRSAPDSSPPASTAPGNSMGGSGGMPKTRESGPFSRFVQTIRGSGDERAAGSRNRRSNNPFNRQKSARRPIKRFPSLTNMESILDDKP